MTTEPTSGQYDRTILPLVAPDHALGPLRRMGRFEWEKVLLRSRFKRSSVKIVGLAAATYATTGTGADVRPGITRLIAVTGLGDSMVRRNLKALESAGFMFMVASGSNYGRGGKGAASDYQLTAPEPMAEQYEAERNEGTWDETDQWDMGVILDHQSPSTGDLPVDNPEHQSPSTGDNHDHRSPNTDDQEKNTGTFGVSPVLSPVSPVLGAQNTGTPVPPTSPLPLHEIPLQQTSHQSVDRHLSNAREETTAEKNLIDGSSQPSSERLQARADAIKPDTRASMDAERVRQGRELMKLQAEYERTQATEGRAS